MQFYARGSSQASDHLRKRHKDEYARLSGAGGKETDASSVSSLPQSVQTKLLQHQLWRGITLQRAHKYLAGFLIRSLLNLVNNDSFKDFKLVTEER